MNVKILHNYLVACEILEVSPTWEGVNKFKKFWKDNNKQ